MAKSNWKTENIPDQKGHVVIVTGAASGLGFEYSQHFSKFFKVRTGMSPKEYRSMN